MMGRRQIVTFCIRGCRNALVASMRFFTLLPLFNLLTNLLLILHELVGAICVPTAVADAIHTVIQRAGARYTVGLVAAHIHAVIDIRPYQTVAVVHRVHCRATVVNPTILLRNAVKLLVPPSLDLLAPFIKFSFHGVIFSRIIRTAAQHA